MPQPYYAARKNLPISASQWTQWEEYLRASPEHDELGRSVGATVCSNLRKDGMIGTPGMCSLLRRVLLDTEGSEITYSTTAAAIDAYVGSCHQPQHQRRGRPARVAGDVLWHVMTEDQLRESVNLSTFQPRFSQSWAWVAFRDACISGRTEDAYRLISANGLRLHPKGYQVYATFACRGGPGGGQPDQWDATTACAALGLSKEWAAYSPGQLLWMVKYKRLAGVGTIAVPTVADADWRSIFTPTKNRTAEVGQALPLGPYAGHSPCMPEVVHASGDLFPSPAPRATAVSPLLVDIPRFLGRTSGW